MGGIVWLASYPKSGNTWTRNFLHNLLRPGAGSHDINDMKMLTAYENAALWFAPLADKPLEECSNEAIAALRHRAQERLAAEAEGLVFAKTHNALVEDYGVLSVNTRVTAGAIYIVRNPLDVAISYAHHIGTTIDAAIAQMNRNDLQTRNTAKQVYETLGSWRQHVTSWTAKPHPGKFVMRYEDMLTKPRETFGALCGFLRIAVSAAELDAAIDRSSFERLQAQEREKGFAERPEKAASFFREGKAGAWRETLTADQVHAVVAFNRDVMDRFNYRP